MYILNGKKPVSLDLAGWTVLICYHHEVNEVLQDESEIVTGNARVEGLLIACNDFLLLV